MSYSHPDFALLNPDLSELRRASSDNANVFLYRSGVLFFKMKLKGIPFMKNIQFYFILPS